MSKEISECVRLIIVVVEGGGEVTLSCRLT